MILLLGMAPLQELLAKAPVIPSSLAPFSINLPGASILFLFDAFNIDNSHRHIKSHLDDFLRPHYLILILMT